MRLSALAALRRDREHWWGQPPPCSSQIAASLHTPHRRGYPRARYCCSRQRSRIWAEAVPRWCCCCWLPVRLACSWPGSFSLLPGEGGGVRELYMVQAPIALLGKIGALEPLSSPTPTSKESERSSTVMSLLFGDSPAGLFLADWFWSVGFQPGVGSEWTRARR
jgi:hypothetical protein